ncbi:hypothetical protein BDV23DRAFT_155587 [Aspergillus alliaceus]|uniref:Uncharacterized protein n=1 Tax=Petromyces alliaceus TaxID=209559 RepID=A0A5N7C897_PETAA|nr:hypothetical protein BDV23DRAFT_155587 [Aspergillus alliaceus]
MGCAVLSEGTRAFVSALSLASGRDLQVYAALAFFPNWFCCFSSPYWITVMRSLLAESPMSYCYHHVTIFVSRRPV